MLIPAGTAEPKPAMALGEWGRRLSGTATHAPAAGGAALQGQGAGGEGQDGGGGGGGGAWATPAEASGWSRTSTAAETLAYVEALATSDLPSASRLVLSQYGHSEEGRPLTLVTVSEPPIVRGSLSELKGSSKIRIHVNANIHAGEVEGKEAVQQLLRELAQGDHASLLEHAILLFSICCNPDGNEAFSDANRVDQNGPDLVGVRPNANGLDLNRDFIKAEAAEVRGLLRIFEEADPAVFVDLHATDGSHHGYHVTYATSLSPNVDGDIAAFAAGEFLPDIQARCLEEHGVRAFDYGNFLGKGEDRSWVTYDHRPRFGTNCKMVTLSRSIAVRLANPRSVTIADVGLRNRISVLSEVYSHLGFEERTRVSRALVLEVCAAAIEHRDTIGTLEAAADARAAGGEGGLRYGSDCELAPPTVRDVLVGSCTAVERPQGTRLIADAEYEAVAMPVADHFVARRWTALPRHGWAVLPHAGMEMGAVIDLLQLHGLRHEQVAEPLIVDSAAAFDVSEVIVHETKTPHGPAPDGITLAGEWADAGSLRLPSGSVVVSAEDPRAMLSAQLLEPLSSDGMFTYSVLALGEGEECPVVQLRAAPRPASSL